MVFCIGKEYFYLTFKKTYNESSFGRNFYKKIEYVVMRFYTREFAGDFNLF
ncbi:hypothetical protein BN1002_01309 [Bacillus sp. B-jedd]|nr:hypothetical protein BN1002_01309 [Bacillus sp. B-jedd]